MIWWAKTRWLLNDRPEDYTHALMGMAGKKKKKRWIKTYSQIQTQGLHRHLTSSLCRSKLTAGPSGKRMGGRRMERQHGGELGNAGVQGQQWHWLKQIILKQTWEMIFFFFTFTLFYLPSRTSLLGYFTVIYTSPLSSQKRTGRDETHIHQLREDKILFSQSYPGGIR